MHVRENMKSELRTSQEQGVCRHGRLPTTATADPTVSVDPAIPTWFAIATSMPRTALALDILERIIVMGFYGWLVARITLASTAACEKLNVLLLISEGLVVFFMMIRRQARDVSRSWVDWAIASLATSLPLWVAPVAGRSLINPSVAATVLTVGILIQLLAKVVLGRSFGMVPAHRGLKTRGPYRLVRHPMYAGYLLTHLAFLAMNATGWNLFVYTICYSVQVPRLLAEERLLKQDTVYRRYAEAVRYRLLPGMF